MGKLRRLSAPVTLINPYRAARVAAMLKATGASMRLDRFRESMGPDNFDALLSDRMNKRLSIGYKVWDDAWKNLVTIRKGVSYLTQYIIRMGEFANIDSLATTGGVFQEATPPADDEISYTVGGYGNLISVDFQTKKTDNLNWFGKMSFNAGKAAVRTFHNWFFVTNLQSNPTVDDGNSLFDNTNHVNDNDAAGAGRDLNYANAATAWETLRAQTDANGNPIFLTGAYLVCGTTYEINAKTLVENDTNPDTANDEKNFFKGILKGYAVSPYLGNDWYMFADPNVFETFEVGFLDDQVDPQLLMMDPDVSDEYFKTKHTIWRIEHYYGGNWVDWRGVVRGSQDV